MPEEQVFKNLSEDVRNSNEGIKTTRELKNVVLLGPTYRLASVLFWTLCKSLFED